MPRLLRSPTGAFLVTSALLVAAPARAAPTGAQLESARRLFVQAEVDEDAGRWGQALEELRAVSEVKLTAGVRYHIALCEEHLGRLSRALADYQAADAQAQAERSRDVLRLVGKQVAALEARIPRLTVHLIPDAADATVKVDGEPVALSLLAGPIGLDPGTHSVEAATTDRPPTTVTVTLQEHDETLLELRLADVMPSPPTGEPAPPVAVAPSSAGATLPPAAEASGSPATTTATATPPSPAADAAPAEPTPGRGSSLGAVVATTLTVALAAGGAVAFAVAGSEHDRGVTDCARVIAPSSDACDPERARVRDWDFAAAAAWGAAVVSGAVAVVLWASPRRATTAAGLELLAGPAALGLRGHF